MNAYELADYIELHKYNSNYKHIEETILMLRQQADRIVQLQEQLHWLVQNPLKELSDEEIWAIASVIEPIDLSQGVRLSNEFNVLDFARAIIKASRGEE